MTHKPHITPSRHDPERMDDERYCGQCRQLEQEVELLRIELEEARRWEAVCHCGLELSRHSELTEHVATEATVPCPNEDALKAAMAVLHEITAKAAYEGDDDYFQIASMGIKR